jgi:isocitrate lyase
MQSRLGGVLNAFELMKAMINWCAGVHWEDQLVC